MNSLDRTALAIPSVPVNTWIEANWENFLTLGDRPEYKKGKFYYYNGWMRIEMAPIGSAHSQDNSLVSTAVILYAALNNIRIKELTNCSLRKTGIRESQPDISFYIGDRFDFPPRNNSPIDLDLVPPPHLVIEIGSSSFLDDVGQKRLMYENLGIQEYWVVNVRESQILAFSVRDRGSSQIRTSQVLPQLEIDLLEEALRRSQVEDDGAIARWLMAQFT
ncbi:MULTISPECIES: Uma2 family endonuclease [Spirulina sp. CCY15215]|uniref:Uma2 family endonuclease n=1 Tax=Spirulina sp. CCY15215 TaxID=2767591 RepID=UPI00194ED55F|nr:Uma2 family endonuclease [Spirulina major]